jgi:hypothetical protein
MDESKNFLSLRRLQKEIAKKYGKISVEALRQRILDGSIVPDYVRTKKGKITEYYFLVDRVDEIGSSIFKQYVKKEEAKVKSETYISMENEEELENKIDKIIDEEIKQRYAEARKSKNKLAESKKVSELISRLYDEKEKIKEVAKQSKNIEELKAYVHNLSETKKHELERETDYNKLYAWRKRKYDEAKAKSTDSSGKLNLEKFREELSKMEEEEKKLRAEGYFKP